MLIFKSFYKPRFALYFVLSALVHIADGIITLFAGLFGYECDLYTNYCEWNIRKDIERRRIIRGRDLT